jgi:hypothetical protein
MPPILKGLFPDLPNFITIRRNRRQQTGTSTSQSRSSFATFQFQPSELIDGIQLVAPFVQAAAGAIPVAGPPLNAAISGLLQIINITDVGRSSRFKPCLLITPQTKNKNKAALDGLSSRVRQLSDFLSLQPEPQDEVEAQRRVDLTK